MRTAGIGRPHQARILLEQPAHPGRVGPRMEAADPPVAFASPDLLERRRLVGVLLSGVRIAVGPPLAVTELDTAVVWSAGISPGAFVRMDAHELPQVGRVGRLPQHLAAQPAPFHELALDVHIGQRADDARTRRAHHAAPVLHRVAIILDLPDHPLLGVGVEPARPVLPQRQHPPTVFQAGARMRPVVGARRSAAHQALPPPGRLTEGHDPVVKPTGRRSQKRTVRRPGRATPLNETRSGDFRIGRATAASRSGAGGRASERQSQQDIADVGTSSQENTPY